VHNLETERLWKLRPGEDTGSFSGDDPRGQSQAQLVQQAGSHNISIEARAALEQDRTVPGSSEMFDGFSRVDVVRAGNDNLGNRLGSPA
jgi:hypothetical protein